MLFASEEEVCILWNMIGEIKSIVFNIKMLTCLLLCCSSGNVIHDLAANSNELFSVSEIINLEKCSKKRDKALLHKNFLKNLQNY